jgi:sugar phosphate permease
VAEDPLERTLRYRWLMFWILAAGYVLVNFHRLCTAVVAVDMMRDLAAGGTLVGVLGSAYFYPYAVMQLPAGLLADSWGPRKTITTFFIVAFAGSVLLGAAPSATWAITGRVLVGIGVSMLFVPTMKVLAEWFRLSEFATMTGIFLAMAGLGALTAAAPLAWMSGWIGWRLSFVAVGLATFVLAVLAWVFVRDRPSDLGWPAPHQGPASVLEPISLREGVRRVLTYLPFWPLAAWFFFECSVFFAFGGLWGGPYLMQIHGLDRGQAGEILSMSSLGMMVGSPFLSFASNRIFRARKPVMILTSAITMGLVAILAFRTDSISIPALYLVCAGLGVFSAAAVTIGFTTAKELFPVQIAGTAVGLVNLFPFSGGAVFQPLLGAILESHGRTGGAFTVAAYRASFLTLLGSAAVAFLTSFFLKETLADRRTSRRQ